MGFGLCWCIFWGWGRWVGLPLAGLLLVAESFQAGLMILLPAAEPLAAVSLSDLALSAAAYVELADITHFE